MSQDQAGLISSPGRVKRRRRKRHRRRSPGWLRILTTTVLAVGASLILALALFRAFCVVTPGALPPPPARTVIQIAHARAAASQWKEALQGSGPAPVPAVVGRVPVRRHRNPSRQEPRAALPAPQQVVITESDLNTLLDTHPSEGLERVLARPQVQFARDMITVTGFVPWQGAYAPLRIEGTPTINRGTLYLHLSTASVAGLPAPGFLKGAVQRQLNQLVHEHIAAVRRVTAVQVEDGHLVLQTS